MKLQHQLSLGASLADVYLKASKAQEVRGLKFLDMTFCVISAGFSCLLGKSSSLQSLFYLPSLSLWNCAFVFLLKR